MIITGTCLPRAQKKCYMTSKMECETKCRGIRIPTWNPDMCRLKITTTVSTTTVPYAVLCQWMIQISRLKICTQVQLCKLEQMCTTRPEKLQWYILQVIYKKQPSIQFQYQQTLRFIFASINQFIMSRKPYNPQPYHSSYTAISYFKTKLVMWQLEVKRISQERGNYVIVQALFLMITQIRSYEDCFPILTEITRCLRHQSITTNCKNSLESLQLDIRRVVMIQKCTYLLTTYDAQITVTMKAKLSQIIIMEVNKLFKYFKPPVSI